MAKAKALCTCSECGETFIKTADKRNRTEADNWEAWAVHNFTQCPKCFGIEQRAKEKETPLYAELKINPFSGNGIIVLGGNTMERKDEIKKLGFLWDEEPCSGIFGALPTSSRKCWSRQFDIAKTQEIIAEIKTMDITIRNEVSDIDIMAAKHIAAQKYAKKVELEGKLETIKRPDVPEILCGHKWNQKIYGRKGNYSIYPDSVKTEISDTQAEQIEVYLKEKEEYKKKVEEVKSGIL